MTPQDFKVLLDVLIDINSNLEKIAKFEALAKPLSELIELQLQKLRIEKAGWYNE